MCPGRVHATTFGGCPKYVRENDAQQKLADAHQKVAETLVMEFGE